MTSTKKDPMDIVALLLGLFVLAFWIIVLAYKYLRFGYYDWDLAFFSQAMWSLSHGSSHVSLFDVNFFANHANLIAYLVLPIFKIFPFPLTLVYLKVISYVAAALILYIIAKENLNPMAAVLFLLFYMIYVPNVLGIAYEFDFESLAPVVMISLFYFYIRDRWLAFLIAAVLLMLMKENMPLVILAFSIHALFAKKDKLRWAVTPGLMALLSFYLLMYIFMPFCKGLPMGKENGGYIAYNYDSIGGSILGILGNMLFHPLMIWSHIANPVNYTFLENVFLPLMGLPLARPDILFFVSPLFLQHLLSETMAEHSIEFAYILPLAPFIFLAAVYTLKIFYRKNRKAYFLLLVLFSLANISGLLLYVPTIESRLMNKENWLESNEMVEAQWKLFKMIPSDAPVVASFEYLAPLSQRKELYSFHKIFDNAYQNDQSSFKLPPNVDYALVDFNDGWLLQDIHDDPYFVKKCFESFFSGTRWSVIRHGENVLFVQKKVPMAHSGDYWVEQQRYGKVVLYKKIHMIRS